MSDPVLEAREVSVRRGESAILSDLSVSIRPDERVLVQGPSGAGKSTLFSVLGLLERPDSGSVFVDGRDTGTIPERERARLRRSTIGFVYQDFKLIPDLTARENAALPQEHTGERDDAWLDRLFDQLDIADLGDRRPASLSGGEKQRVAAARALANRPAIVLADEPTGQLDPDTADRLLDLLCSLQAELETTLVLVSHDRSLVDRFPRQFRLSDGRLQATE